MHERPHHAHKHMNLHWRDFVTRPWRGPRGITDYNLLKAAGGYEEVNAQVETKCLCNYTWNEIIPCSVKDSVLVEGYGMYMYELMPDGSGRAYPSIVDLRRDKILNFLTLPDMRGVRSFHPQQYEKLNEHGTASLLKTLEEATGKKAQCEAYTGTGIVKHKSIDKDFIRWMNKFVDWEVEGMIGYEKREP